MSPTVEIVAPCQRGARRRATSTALSTSRLSAAHRNLALTPSNPCSRSSSRSRACHGRARRVADSPRRCSSRTRGRNHQAAREKPAAAISTMRRRVADVSTSVTRPPDARLPAVSSPGSRRTNASTAKPLRRGNAGQRESARRGAPRVRPPQRRRRGDQDDQRREREPRAQGPRLEASPTVATHCTRMGAFDVGDAAFRQHGRAKADCAAARRRGSRPVNTASPRADLAHHDHVRGDRAIR